MLAGAAIWWLNVQMLRNMHVMLQWKRNWNDQLLAPPRTTHDIRLTGIFQDNSDKRVLE